jgi:membrane-associated phospholipid phosphatase
VVRRARPDRSGLQVSAGGIPVREPKTSSFPSGHTLAAFCAATVMSQSGDRGGNALLFTSATLVGLSRVHLRAHHASDVVGGAAIGIAVGLIGRRLV